MPVSSTPLFDLHTYPTTALGGAGIVPNLQQGAPLPDGSGILYADYFNLSGTDYSRVVKIVYSGLVATELVARTAGLPAHICGICVEPTGTYAYICQGGDSGNRKIFRVVLANGTYTLLVDLTSRLSVNPTHLHIDPLDSTMLMIIGAGGNQIARYDMVHDVLVDAPFMLPIFPFNSFSEQFVGNNIYSWIQPGGPTQMGPLVRLDRVIGNQIVIAGYQGGGSEALGGRYTSPIMGRCIAVPPDESVFYAILNSGLCLIDTTSITLMDSAVNGYGWLNWDPVNNYLVANSGSEIRIYH